jgi:hypothetical protein
MIGYAYFILAFVIILSSVNIAAGTDSTGNEEAQTKDYNYPAGAVLIDGQQYDVTLSTDQFMDQASAENQISEIFDPTLGLPDKFNILIKDSSGALVTDTDIHERVITALIWRSVARRDILVLNPADETSLKDVMGDKNNPIFLLQMLTDEAQNTVKRNMLNSLFRPSS